MSSTRSLRGWRGEGRDLGGLFTIMDYVEEERVLGRGCC
jgi:hypothetical protein